MATTCYFEEVIQDQAGLGKPIELEFGTSTYLQEGLIYLRINDNAVLVDKATMMLLREKLEDAMLYLGYLNSEYDIQGRPD